MFRFTPKKTTKSPNTTRSTKQLHTKRYLQEKGLNTSDKAFTEVVIGGPSTLFNVMDAYNNNKRKENDKVTIISGQSWEETIHPTYRQAPWGQTISGLPPEQQTYIRKTDKTIRHDTKLQFGHIQDSIEKARKDGNDILGLSQIKQHISTVTTDASKTTTTHLENDNTMQHGLDKVFFYGFARVPVKPLINMLDQQKQTLETYQTTAHSILYSYAPDSFNHDIALLGTGPSSLWSHRNFNQNLPAALKKMVCVIGPFGKKYENTAPGHDDINLNHIPRLMLPATVEHFDSKEAFHDYQFNIIEKGLNIHLHQDESKDLINKLYFQACEALGFATIMKDENNELIVTGITLSPDETQPNSHKGAYITLTVPTIYSATGIRYNHQILENIPADRKTLGAEESTLIGPRSLPFGARLTISNEYRLATGQTPHGLPWIISKQGFKQIQKAYQYRAKNIHSEERYLDDTFFNALQQEYANKAINHLHELPKNLLLSLMKKAYFTAYPTRSAQSWNELQKAIAWYGNTKQGPQILNRQEKNMTNDNMSTNKKTLRF